jgi:hypothetical protein
MHKVFYDELEDEIAGGEMILDEDIDGHLSAVNLKNLRQRKHINYNEDKGLN